MKSLSNPSSILTGIIRLAHHRWTFRLMVALGRGEANRFSVFERRLGINPQTLDCHLGVLADWGWIERNPGYGHPLRPDYLLTAPGRKVARAAVPCWQVVESLSMESLVRAKWTLPVLTDLAFQPKGFAQLRRELEVTPRALSESLKVLKASALVESTARHEIKTDEQRRLLRLDPFKLSPLAAPLAGPSIALANSIAEVGFR